MPIVGRTREVRTRMAISLSGPEARLSCPDLTAPGELEAAFIGTSLVALGLLRGLGVRIRACIRPTHPALMMSALALLGCGSGTEVVEPQRPRPVLSMTPSDLTSAVG